MQVEWAAMLVGARVRNTYIIYPLVEDIPWKRGAILHMLLVWHRTERKSNAKG
jgi:hypothetical protein